MDRDERTRGCRVARDWICERLDVKVAAERLVDDYEETLGS
jgi:phage terminase Nu1 subunit (DNA packaging protein)